MYVLWLLGRIAPGDALGPLLKMPAILADVGIAALLARLGGRWLGWRRSWRRHAASSRRSSVRTRR